MKETDRYTDSERYIAREGEREIEKEADKQADRQRQSKRGTARWGIHTHMHMRRQRKAIER